MATINRKTTPIYTHEGAKAKRINPYLQLRRSVLACLLWEDSFYEDGKSIADRICVLVKQNDPKKVMDLAVEARMDFKLRHIPLLLLRELARYKEPIANTLAEVIQRPDELTEFLAIYWKDGKQPLSAQVKKGLSKAFTKFNEYQLAKYNRANEIKLRDVLFLCHAKPLDKDQESLWKRLANDELQIPDTWEVNLSTGKDKTETWTRLLAEDKLGAMALLRNLRNMQESRVGTNLIKESLLKMNVERVLPYRFISAARYALNLEPELELAMFKCINDHPKLDGQTALLVDVSGSMEDRLSSKSEVRRIDAACGLAVLLREICEDVRIFSFSDEIKEIPSRRGFALRDSIINSQTHGGTFLGAAVKSIYSEENVHVNYSSFRNRYDTIFRGYGLTPDRLIVFTDEQSHDTVPDPNGVGYMINIATNKNGVGYGVWNHIDGFSESVIRYIYEYERTGQEKI